MCNDSVTCSTQTTSEKVHDASAERPRRCVPGADECGGRGLVIVGALVDHWGVSERDGAGKVVWALLAAPGACA